VTTQEAYERMRVFFSRPNARIALTEGGTCVYRGEDDPASPLRCAVGCLIPDDQYHYSFEGEAIYDEIVAKVPAIQDVDIDFLLQAQESHDASASPIQFIGNLDAIADDWDLNIARAKALCAPAGGED